MSVCATRVDIAIVGAGVSGLACAALLQTKHSVAVLEARQRVGGRLLSRNGVDLGASWSWPPHDERVGALSRQLGIDTVDQHLDGEAFHSSGGNRAQAVGNVGSQMAPCGPGAVRFMGGYATLPRALADKLPDGSLMTGCRVISVNQSEGGIQVAYEQADGGDGVRYLDAKRVVIALPPGVSAATMSFEPPLPDAQRHKMASTATWCGDWCKLVATFRSPFWRSRGASGVVGTPGGPIQVWWEGGGGTELGEPSAALVGLGVGEACKALAPMQTADGGPMDDLEPAASAAPAPAAEASLRQYVIGALGPAYGGVVEEELLSASVKVWMTDDLTYASAGSHRDYGHRLLRQPTAWGVHFAGTETEARNGHVEGALAAAERAAKEVLDAMAGEN